MPLMVLVNPVVTPLTDEMEEGWEGCLSVPDMRGMVPRYTSVRLQCLDREGQTVDVIAKDFFARVCQHETDHLNGMVYLDRMRNLATLSHVAEWNKHWLGIREQDDYRQAGDGRRSSPSSATFSSWRASGKPAGSPACGSSSRELPSRSRPRSRSARGSC